MTGCPFQLKHSAKQTQCYKIEYQQTQRYKMEYKQMDVTKWNTNKGMLQN